MKIPIASREAIAAQADRAVQLEEEERRAGGEVMSGEAVSFFRFAAMKA